MAQYTRTFSTTCPGDLIDAINNNNLIVPELVQVIDLGTGDAIFDFTQSLSASEETTLDTVLSSWVCPVQPTTTETDEFTADDTTTASNNFWSSEKVVDYIDATLAGTPGSNPNSVLGKTYSVGFAHSAGNAKNAWLRQESVHTGASSDTVPFVLPWNSRLISVTFANGSSAADQDLQLWSSPAGQDPMTNKTLFHTVQIRNDRTVVVTDFGVSNVDFVRGDKIAIFMQDQGDDAANPVVHLMFLVTDDTIGNTTDTFTNDFSS